MSLTVTTLVAAWLVHRLLLRRRLRLRNPLVCALGIRLHDPVKAGSGWRCARCGKKAASAIELLDPKGEDSRVRTARWR